MNKQLSIRWKGKSCIPQSKKKFYWITEKMCVFCILFWFVWKMIKKMCFSIKGLRRCEVYEQNSEASIWRRFMYSHVSSSFFFVLSVCVCALWDKYRFAAYRPRLPMCVSVWFVSFFLSLGVARCSLPLGLFVRLLCMVFCVFRVCVLLCSQLRCVSSARCCNAHIIVIIYLALWIVRTEISLLRVYVCARGCSRLLLICFILFFFSSLLSLYGCAFFYFFSYSLLVHGIYWDPYKATHIARILIHSKRSHLALVFCMWMCLLWSTVPLL